MFNTASMFGRPPAQTGPSSGITRQPGNGGLLGEIDINQVIEHLKTLYPEADIASLQAMARERTNWSQASRADEFNKVNQQLGTTLGQNQNPYQSPFSY